MFLFKMLLVMFIILTSLTALNTATPHLPAVGASPLPVVLKDTSNTTFDKLDRRSNYDGQPSGLGIVAYVGDNCVGDYF